MRDRCATDAAKLHSGRCSAPSQTKMGKTRKRVVKQPTQAACLTRCRHCRGVVFLDKCRCSEGHVCRAPATPQPAPTAPAGSTWQICFLFNPGGYDGAKGRQIKPHFTLVLPVRCLHLVLLDV